MSELHEIRITPTGSDLTSLWLTDLNHAQLNSAIAPEVITWFNSRFAGLPNASTCNQPLPVTPATRAAT